MARPISRKLCFEALESRRLLTQWNVFPSGGAPTAPVKVKFEPIVDAAEHSLSNIRKKDDMTKELIYDDGTGAGQTTGLSVENLEQIEIVGGSLRDSIELVAGLHTLPLKLTLLEVQSKAGDDWIVGAASVVMALGAIPEYQGGSDVDTIQGGSGRERIYGGEGGDFLYGHDGNDTIHGGGPQESAVGWTGLPGDTIEGGYGNDTIWGSPDSDRIKGGRGRDEILGGHEIDNALSNNKQGDVIEGGPGNDIIKGGYGDDIIYGNYDWTAGDDPDPGAGETDEDNIEGEGGSDEIYGQADVDTIKGGSGTDWLYGGTGDDVFDGGTERDFIRSNMVFWAPDEPYEGNIKGTGGPGCDQEDSHEEDCAPKANPDGAYNVISGQPFKLAAFNPDLPNDPNSVWTKGILANDIPGGDCGCPFVIGQFTITHVGGTSMGQFVLETNAQDQQTGGFTYTAEQRVAGEFTVTYTVADPHGVSNEATITFNVANPPPTGNPDTYDALGGSWLTVGEDPNVAPYGVLKNDIDPNGDSLQALLVQDAQFGHVELDMNGGFTYESFSNNPGTDSFTYQVLDGVNVVGPITVTINNIVPVHSLRLNAPAIKSSTPPSITQDDVRRFLLAAGERWHEAGVSSAAVRDVLSGITVVVTDLPGSQLATVTGSVLYVDSNAAGYGWFLDVTPESDREFGTRISSSELQAGPRSPAYGHADLLTAMEHEVGHLFGLEHGDGDGSLMNGEIGLGTRRLPTAREAALAELLYTSNRRR